VGKGERDFSTRRLHDRGLLSVPEAFYPRQFVAGNVPDDLSKEAASGDGLCPLTGLGISDLSEGKGVW
jgi:hypothetical protein